MTQSTPKTPSPPDESAAAFLLWWVFWLHELGAIHAADLFLILLERNGPMTWDCRGDDMAAMRKAMLREIQNLRGLPETQAPAWEDITQTLRALHGRQFPVYISLEHGTRTRKGLRWRVRLTNHITAIPVANRQEVGSGSKNDTARNPDDTLGGTAGGFTNEIRRQIRSCGLTPYRIAKQTGIPPGNMCRFLAGKTGLRLAAVDRIAEFLHLRVCSDGTMRQRREDGDLWQV